MGQSGNQMNLTTKCGLLVKIVQIAKTERISDHNGLIL